MQEFKREEVNRMNENLKRVEEMERKIYDEELGKLIDTIDLSTLKIRDAGSRKAWQTCYGPAVTSGKRDKHDFKGRNGRNAI